LNFQNAFQASNCTADHGITHIENR